MADAHAITDRNGVKKPRTRDIDIDIDKAPSRSRWMEDKPERSTVI
jgi:hypothetical protein